MTQPVRLRLSRAKGFDLQAHSLATNGLPAVNVARPGPWGNPFVVGKDGDRASCVRLHAILLCGLDAITHASIDEQKKARTHAAKHLDTLRGKNLACWCNGSPCHADTLLALAAAPDDRARSEILRPHLVSIHGFRCEAMDQ